MPGGAGGAAGGGKRFVIYRAIFLVAGCLILETTEQILYRLAGRGRKELGGKYWGYVSPGVAIPLLGLNYVAIALAGRFLFGEQVDARRWLGTAMVVAGFVLVAGTLQ